MSTPASFDQIRYRNLRQEVEDLLDAGLVGLYEIPSFLQDDLPAPDRLAYATAVLADILEEGRARLVWNRWASDVPPTDASSTVPTERDWAYPPAERYLALEPVDRG